jgi:ParB/RepB/Spo0J family partition protein
MELQHLELGLIHPHKANPRHDVGNVTELAASIKAQGVLEPLIVATGGDDFGFTLIAGHRRLAAAQKANLKTVPCIVRDDLTTAELQLEAMLVENVQRTDLTAVEEAEAYQALLEFPDYTIEKITKKIGRSVKTVKQRLSIAALPEAVKQKAHTGQVSLADAVKLAEFADEPAVVEHLAKSLGTNNFGYYLNSAKTRREKIAEARAAGVTVYPDSAALLEEWPDACSLPYGTKPAPGLLAAFRVDSSYANWYAAQELPEDDTDDEDTGDDSSDVRSDIRDRDLQPRSNPNAGGSMVDARKAKESREVDEEARQIRLTAEATRLAFIRETLQEKTLRAGAVRNGLREAIWEILYELSDTALEIVQLAPPNGNYLNPDELTRLGRAVTDAMELPNLVVLATATALSSSAGQTLNYPIRNQDIEELRSADRWFTFLVSLGYDMNDVDTAQLTAIEARIAELEAIEAGASDD